MKIFVIDTKASNKTDLLYDIAAFAEKQKICTSTNRVLKAFVDREKEFSTAFENEIAIPHARVKEITESAIIIARNDKGIDWASMDGKPTKFAISLLIEGSSSAGSEHMEVLAAVSSLLIDPKNIQVFKSGTVENIQKIIDAKLASDKKPEKSNSGVKKYDFVAVTSCPTGVAHTNMAAEALERFAKENKLICKVERQAAQGVVSQLSQEDVDKANHVIIAVGRQIDGMERFDGKKLIKVGVAEPMKDAAKLWKNVQTAEVYHSATKAAGGGSTMKASSADKVSVMAAIMTGLSYMIPIVIVGGIFLAFGLGIGRIAVGGDVSGDMGTGTIWAAIFNIGVVGINLAVVILGGFIAQAIGGRLALTPALILSAVCQGVGIVTPGSCFFNYSHGSFGGFPDGMSTNLSFFGSIVAGFLFGYAAKYWTIYVSPKLPKWVKTIEPIILVPILFVFVGFILFGFVLYLPLYWLAYGLGEGVKEMTKHNLIWIVGLIGGAMLCFDMGGPINKIAFSTGVFFLDPKNPQNFHPEVMGAIAAAGSVSPVGMALGWFLGAKVLRIQKLNNDEMLRDSFVPALFMGLVGISEGAIPFALRNPKTAIISNVVGGAIAGAISGAFLITDNAAHTGPIVWILGAVGRNGNTDYAYGLLYIMAFAVGSVVTALMFATLEFFIGRRKGEIASFKEIMALNKAKKANKKAGIRVSKSVENNSSTWKGYAWKHINIRK